MALRDAHELYLEALGSEIVMLERVAEHLGEAGRFEDELEQMRRFRALQEVRCAELRRTLARALL